MNRKLIETLSDEVKKNWCQVIDVDVSQFRQVLNKDFKQIGAEREDLFFNVLNQTFCLPHLRPHS